MSPALSSLRPRPGCVEKTAHFQEWGSLSSGGLALSDVRREGRMWGWLGMPRVIFRGPVTCPRPRDKEG